MKIEKYEIVLILKPELEKEAVDEACEKVKKLIEKSNGKVVDTIFWGKKKLAYQINKIDKGIYVIILFDGPTTIVKEISEILTITGEVLRFMVSKGYKLKKQAAEGENPEGGESQDRQDERPEREFRRPRRDYGDRNNKDKDEGKE